MNLCFDKIHGIPLDDKWIAFGMTKAVYFKVYVKIRPFDSLRTGHLYVEYATDGCILHPWDTVIGQEIVMSLYGKHDSLSINHQYAYQCVGGIVP